MASRNASLRPPFKDSHRRSRQRPRPRPRHPKTPPRPAGHRQPRRRHAA